MRGRSVCGNDTHWVGTLSLLRRLFGGSPTSSPATIPSGSTSSTESDYLRYVAETQAFEDACTAKGQEAQQSPVPIEGKTYTSTTFLFSAHHPNVAVCSYTRVIQNVTPTHHGICFEDHPDLADCFAIPSKYIRPAKPPSGG